MNMNVFSSEKLNRHLDELASIKPSGFPFVSLYLNTQADQHGRDNFAPFVRKEFTRQLKELPLESPERVSFERDRDRIENYLQKELRASANGLALFACSGADGFFTPIQLDVPIPENELYVADTPQLYPLARVADQYPKYAALLADTDTARVFVFDLGQTKHSDELDNTGSSLAADGVRTQLRYRRRVDNYNLLHAKQVVQMLDRVVQDEGAEHVILAGDEVIIPLLRAQLPPHLADKVIDILRLDIRTPEHEILRATMNALREDNVQTDAEKVRELLDSADNGGFVVSGLGKTMSALVNGQVDELLLTASADTIRIGEEPAPEFAGMPASAVSRYGRNEQNLSPDMLAGALISLARSTGAAVTFIEDAALLADVGGVGGFLRYRV